jgi:enterochelin esterase-like enzyme
LLVLAALLLVAPEPGRAGSLGEDIRLESKVLGYAVQYRVYVPDRLPEGRLPTLYVTDGAWYLEQGGMKARLDALVGEGRIRPLVAVFVDSRDPDDLSVNRRNEQLICKTDYARFFASELVPAVEARLPTGGGAGERTILGLSFGALNAACFGLAIPQVFGNLALQSPASDRHLRIVADRYRAEERQPLRIFLSVGKRNDNGREVRRFRGILEEKGYAVTFREVPFGHDWRNWGPLLDDVLETFFSAEAR